MNDYAQTWIVLALNARGDQPENVLARLAMQALLDARTEHGLLNLTSTILSDYITETIDVLDGQESYELA